MDTSWVPEGATLLEYGADPPGGPDFGFDGAILYTEDHALLRATLEAYGVTYVTLNEPGGCVYYSTCAHGADTADEERGFVALLEVLHIANPVGPTPTELQVAVALQSTIRKLTEELLRLPGATDGSLRLAMLQAVCAGEVIDYLAQRSSLRRPLVAGPGRYKKRRRLD